MAAGCGRNIQRECCVKILFIDTKIGVCMQIELKILDSRLIEWGGLRYHSSLAAGIDLFACINEPVVVKAQAPAVLIPTGIAMHMNDQALCAFILPRSGLGHKKGLVLGNGTGVIDADYTAECFVSTWNRNPSMLSNESSDITINPGDRIAQMVFLPIVRPSFDVVIEFSEESKRGGGGFGSTGGTTK